MMPNNNALVASLDTMLVKGQEQSREFTMDRLVMCKTPIIAPITKNTFLLPSNILASSSSAIRTMTEKEDKRLILHLKSVIQYRHREVKSVLEHEPGNVPPVFTNHNKLYKAPKSALANKRFKPLTSPFYGISSSGSSTVALADTQLVVDLSMISKLMVATLNSSCVTVKDFCNKVWSYINSKKYSRVDIVGDNYETPHLLKNSTRVDRGSGTTVNFDLDSELPSNFKTDFFFCSTNKARLYRLMSDYFATLTEDSDTEFFITQGSSEVSGRLPHSTHLEADFRLICHVIHAVDSGVNQTIVRGNDTDILVILLAYLPDILQRSKTHILLYDYGTGASRCTFDITHIGKLIGLERCRGLLFLYALSGCDYTPSFYGVGKLKFFDLYSETEDTDLIQVFRVLSSAPTILSEHQFNKIKDFVLEAYLAKGGAARDILTTRVEMIGSPLVDSFRQLPPSESALYYATLRASYVAGHLWGKADTFAPEVPCFEDWGWEPLTDSEHEDPNAVLRHIWTTKLDLDGTTFKKVSKVCTCGEKSSCLNKNCSCKDTACLPMCKCRGLCKKDNSSLLDAAAESEQNSESE